MRFRLEVERARLSPRADDDVVGRARADRHAGVRKVRQRFEQHRALALRAVELDLELLDLLVARLARFVEMLSVLALALGARHLIAGRILFALESLDLRNQAAAMRFGSRQLLQFVGNVEAAVRHARLHGLDVVADKVWVKHRTARFGAPWTILMGMSASVRKAVFPAAGLGTRFLPATKAQPKEMLPLVDKPTIQYGVEEALQSGVPNIVVVTGRGKNAIEDHFDVSTELEAFLESRGKKDLADEVRKISNLIQVSYVRQGEPLGLGHAVLVTETIVGNEPFAVILADDVIDATPPALKQMIDVFERAGGPVLAVERVPMDQVSNYGVIAGEPAPDLGKGIYRVTDLVEKPPRSEAPSDLAIIGRYILTPDIFASLHETAKDRSGEIQLTNGLRHLLKSRPIYAVEIDGVRHDTGNKLGFLKASVYFALKRPELADAFREYLKTVK